MSNHLDPDNPIRVAVRKSYELGQRTAYERAIAAIGRGLITRLAPDFFNAPPIVLKADDREHGRNSDPDLESDPHQGLLLAQIDHRIRSMETGEDPEPGDRALHALWEDPEALSRVLAPHAADEPRYQKAIAEAIFLKAAERSPKGGISLKGSFYPGGQWIPSSVLASASPEEKTELAERNQGARPNPLNAREIQQKATAEKRGTRDQLRKQTAVVASDLMLRPDLATPDKYRDLAESLKGDHLSVADLRSLRLKLSASFGGGRRKAQMVAALLAHADSAVHALENPEPEPVPQPKVPKPPKPPKPGTFLVLKTDSIAIDPARFQFKVKVDSFGVTKGLANVKKFDPDFAGVISVWYDPVAQKTFCVNGHHRVELARRTSYPHLAVRYLDAKDAREARAKGALINIAEGRGSALDAAKFLRDSGRGPEDLFAHGISPEETLARQAAVLTTLNDAAFDRLARGSLDLGTALAVAKHLADHDRQEKLFKLIARKEEDGKEFTNRNVEEMARQMAAAPSATITNSTLWGDESSEDDTFLERAEISAHVRAELSKEHHDYSALASERRAGATAEAGNVLNVGENKIRAATADVSKHAYDTLAHRKGPIADALDAAAVQIKQAKSKKEKETIRAHTIATVRGLLADIATGKRPPADGQGVGEVDAGRAGDGATERAGAAQAGAGETPADGGGLGNDADGVKSGAAVPQPSSPNVPSPAPSGGAIDLNDARALAAAAHAAGKTIANFNDKSFDPAMPHHEMHNVPIADVYDSLTASGRLPTGTTLDVFKAAMQSARNAHALDLTRSDQPQHLSDDQRAKMIRSETANPANSAATSHYLSVPSEQPKPAFVPYTPRNRRVGGREAAPTDDEFAAASQAAKPKTPLEKKEVLAPEPPQPAPQQVPEAFHMYASPDEDSTAAVYHHPDGFAVVLHDNDTGESIGKVKTFPTEAEAVSHAEDIAGVASEPVQPAERRAKSKYFHPPRGSGIGGDSGTSVAPPAHAHGAHIDELNAYDRQSAKEIVETPLMTSREKSAAVAGNKNVLPLGTHTGAPNRWANLAPDLLAIPKGDSRFVEGHRVRRDANGSYQVERRGGFLKGDANAIADHIKATAERESGYPSHGEAMARAQSYDEPDPFTDPGKASEDAKLRDEVPEGVKAVSLDDNTRGRVGTVRRDPTTGKVGLQFDGGAEHHGFDFEPLDVRHSWRDKGQREAAKPKAEKAESLFGGDEADAKEDASVKPGVVSSPNVPPKAKSSAPAPTGELFDNEKGNLFNAPEVQAASAKPVAKEKSAETVSRRGGLQVGDVAHIPSLPSVSYSAVSGGKIVSIGRKNAKVRVEAEDDYIREKYGPYHDYTVPLEHIANVVRDGVKHTVTEPKPKPNTEPEPEIAATSPVEQEVANRAVAAPQPSSPNVNGAPKKVAARLREHADKLKSNAADALSRDRLTNTRKRAGQAASAVDHAMKEEAFGDTVHRVANAIENGDAKYLAGVKNASHLRSIDLALRLAMSHADKDLSYYERQQRVGRRPTTADIEHAEYPYPHVFDERLSQFANAISKSGDKKLGAKLAKLAVKVQGNGSRLHDPFDIETIREAARHPEIKKGAGANYKDEFSKHDQHYLKDSLENYDRLRSAGIDSPESLKDALREYIPLKTNAKPESAAAKAERDLVGQKIPGFFPTPKPVIRDMLDKADIKPGMSVLEPSAGKGDILDAIKERHPEAKTDAVEHNGTLRTILEGKGHKLINSDFLQHQGKYDRIVMNPPFESGADIDHVQHAYDQLKPGGRLVAIMSQGPFFRSDKKASEFRKWLGEHDSEHEEMPENSFGGSDAFRQTGVRTRMVTIDKPE